MKDKMGVLKRIELYQSLMEIGSVEGIQPGGALRHILRLVDLAFGLRRTEGIEHALTLAEELRGRRLSPPDDALLHYYQSLSWEKLRLLRAGDVGSVRRWEQSEIEKGLVHLRQALHSREAVAGMPRDKAALILSDLASLFHHVGRFSEAVEHWDRAMKVVRSFPSARGKRGYALTHYAHALYDRRHVELFLRRAREDLKAALDAGLRGEAAGHFRKRLRWVESRLPDRGADKELELFDYQLGSSEDELRYRRWCLEHRLFLNPINDLGPYPAGARDILIVPPVVAAKGRSKGEYYHGFFNQLKQAYVSARYIYYEGVHAVKAHFSDRDVLLFDTMDYPTYSLSVEKIKAAFGMSYSLFDKIARFLNHYMGLSIPDQKVTFRTFWYRDQRVESGLREEFRERMNWPLRGLFWLGKDLYEDVPDEPSTIDPGAKELSEIRYHLERSYLKLQEDFSADTDRPPGAMDDAMAFSVHRGEFEAKTLRLLKMVRSALTYLCLSVHLEERRSAGDAEGKEYLPAMTSGIWEDSRRV